MDVGACAGPPHGAASRRSPGEKEDDVDRSDVLDGAPKAAIDSRAGTTGRVLDPKLHRTIVAEAVAQHRPAVVIFSSPAFG
jgi:hypothetical protein